jgi:hypothetical protein
MPIAPTRSQWRKWSLPSKTTYVGTVAGLLSLALALVSVTPPPKPHNPPQAGEFVASDPEATSIRHDGSARELVALLNSRAARVLAEMREEENERLSAYAANPAAFCPAYPSARALVRQMTASRRLFEQLHEQNIAAINKGQLVVAHEANRDIHLLFETRHKQLYCDPVNQPGAHGVTIYFMLPPRDRYAGPTPCDLEKQPSDREKVIANWIDNVRGDYVPSLCRVGDQEILVMSLPGVDSEGVDRMASDIQRVASRME